MNKKFSDHDSVISHITKRQSELAWAAKQLKHHFVGLDSIIDKIIKSIETWYIMPQLLTRPVIICLWGMTGVGKTDLVRRLVKLLKFSDRFTEIEMSNKGSVNSWHSSVSCILSANPNLKSSQPSIILLDEIQSFRTINEDGHEMHDYKLRDVWALLSDGKLPYTVDVDYLLQMLWDYNKKEQASLRQKHSLPESKEQIKEIPVNIPKKGASVSIAEDPDPMKSSHKMTPITFTSNSLRLTDENEFGLDEDAEMTYYSLKNFQKALRIENPLEEIALWTDAEKKAMILKKINEPQIYEEEDYTKSLIFVSGNLDEAYQFSKQTQESDVEADIFHDMSLKISILDIKEALTRRFKPEQIARFGNSHILYPSLSKKSYQKIIHRKVMDICRNVKHNFGIKIKVDSSIEKMIYDNGVFPTQGTRPVFSTIQESLESYLPNFLLRAFIENCDTINIFYENNAIRGRIGENLLEQPYCGTLDKIKSDKNKNINRRVLTAIHEAGHAVIYAVLLKISPPQIVATIASQHAEGFIYRHSICGAMQLIEHTICVMLAGAEAETMIFGETNRSWGMESDLRHATHYAAKMVRRFAMDHYASYIDDAESDTLAHNDMQGSSQTTESIVRKFKDETRNLLRMHIKLFMETADALVANEKIRPEDFQKMCKKHGVTIEVKSSEQDIYCNYNDIYMKFREQING